MWKSIKPILANLFSSKKFLAFLAGAIVWLIAQLGADISKEAVLELLGLVSVYILGQGIADKGKEAVKEMAKAERLGKPSATSESNV